MPRMLSVTYQPHLVCRPGRKEQKQGHQLTEPVYKYLSSLSLSQIFQQSTNFKFCAFRARCESSGTPHEHTKVPSSSPRSDSLASVHRGVSSLERLLPPPLSSRLNSQASSNSSHLFHWTPVLSWPHQLTRPPVMRTSQRPCPVIFQKN